MFKSDENDVLITNGEIHELTNRILILDDEIQILPKAGICDTVNILTTIVENNRNVTIFHVGDAADCTRLKIVSHNEKRN